MPKLTSQDNLFILLYDHGADNTASLNERFCTYENDGSHSDDYIEADNIDAELDDITVKHMVVELFFCFSGGFYLDLDDETNRFVCTACGDEVGSRRLFLLYGAMKNDDYGSDTNVPRYSYTNNNMQFEHLDDADSVTNGNNDGLVSIDEAQDRADAQATAAGKAPAEYKGTGMPSEIFL